MNTYFFIILILLCFAAVANCAPIIWGGFLEPRAESNGEMTASPNFEIPDALEAVGMQVGTLTREITPQYLSTIDVFFTCSLNPNLVLSSSEQSAIKSWVEDSGGVLVSNGDQVLFSTAYSYFMNLFDIAGSGFPRNEAMYPVPHPNATSSLKYNISEIYFGGNAGTQNGGSTFSVENPDAEIVFWESGEPAIAILENILPGHGDVYSGGDINMFANRIDEADNRQFLQNLMDWVKAVVPLPTPIPTPFPTTMPTPEPTPIQTAHPTPDTTDVPTPRPTPHPTPHPSPHISPHPTPHPTPNPTPLPTFSPIPIPSTSPTVDPTLSPVPQPSSTPTHVPTRVPTVFPIPAPTTKPTRVPTLSPMPSPTSYEEEESESKEESCEDELNNCGMNGQQNEYGDMFGQFIQECKTDGDTLQLSISTNGATQQHENSENFPNNCGDQSQESSDVSTCAFENSPRSNVSVSYVSVDNIGSCFPVSDDQSNHFLSPVYIVEEDGEIDEHRVYEFMFRHQLEDEFVCGDKIVGALKCNWYDAEDERWTSAGCVTVNSTLNETTNIVSVGCRCSHLTAFVILLGIDEKDKCDAYNIFGNSIFIAFACLYSVLLLVALVQIRIVYDTTSETTCSQYLCVHILIACVATLQICVDVTISLNTASFIALSIFWALLHSMSLWAFGIVVLSIAHVYHTATQGRTPAVIRYTVFVTCTFVSITITVMFLLAITRGKAELKQITYYGSIVIGGACIMDSVVFLTYGALVMKTISQHRTKVGAAKNQKRMALVIQRLFRVSLVTSWSFLGESIIYIISGVDQLFFLLHFSLLESLYFVFDLLTLSMILYLYFKVIRERKRVSTETKQSSNQRYGEHEEIDRDLDMLQIYT